MKFMVTIGYTRLDYKKNLDIMKEVNAQPIMEFVENYIPNWKIPCYSNTPLKNRILNSLLPTKQ